MKDAISIERVNKLHPKIRLEVIDLIDKIEHSNPSFIVRVVQGLRTPEEQDHLYALGRTLPGKIVTNAKAWKSNHNYGLSFDFALMYDRDKNGTYESLSWATGEDFDNDKQADWMEVVNLFKSQGWQWGGDWTFKDFPHLEKTFSHSVNQLKAKFDSGNWFIDSGNKYINL